MPPIRAARTSKISSADQTHPQPHPLSTKSRYLTPGEYTGGVRDRSPLPQRSVILGEGRRFQRIRRRVGSRHDDLSQARLVAYDPWSDPRQAAPIWRHPRGGKPIRREL